jgi:hypothetical protein
MLRHCKLRPRGHSKSWTANSNKRRAVRSGLGSCDGESSKSILRPVPSASQCRIQERPPDPRAPPLLLRNPQTASSSQSGRVRTDSLVWVIDGAGRSRLLARPSPSDSLPQPGASDSQSRAVWIGDAEKPRFFFNYSTGRCLRKLVDSTGGSRNFNPIGSELDVFAPADNAMESFVLIRCNASILRDGTGDDMAVRGTRLQSAEETHNLHLGSGSNNGGNRICA